MKIAFIDYVLEPDQPGRTGLSDVVWDMASELVNQGLEAHIIASYHTVHYPDPRVVVHNFVAPPIGYRNIVGQLWLLMRAAAVARNLKADIIHAPEYLSTAVFASLGLQPLVLTVPGNIFKRIREGHSFDWHYVQILKWAARVSARRCARIIAISREMKQWWEWTGSRPENTLWLPYGVDPARFHPIDHAKNCLGFPEAHKLLLYVGRFSREKGLFDLLDALAQLSPDLTKKGVLVYLIGKGSESDEIKRRILSTDLEQLVRVRDWVSQHELPIWYSAADALLLPSWNEPLGRVMFEAMACGTPVIASATEGPKDHITHGKNGLLFPMRDAGGLANSIEEFFSNPERICQMRVDALEYVRSNILWPKIVKRIIDEVYSPILNKDGQKSSIRAI